MKRFLCGCGRFVYFESHHCVACGSVLGFDPDSRSMLSLTEESGRLRDAQGRQFLYCSNGIDYGVCNWLRPADGNHPFCFACRFNRTIPNLEKPVNLARWAKFETGKKRLMYSLLSLRLPLTNGHDDPDNGLLLDFIEDSRTDAYRFPESFVHTGFLGGIITINAAEADDVIRESIRVQMGESYRTLLGHLRHESGHYYWPLLDPTAREIEAFKALFGDLDLDYSAALESYYANGPRADWGQAHISAYASSHPVEDWAETWGHYLHIADVLETAAEYGVIGFHPEPPDIRSAISIWRDLSIVLNELNRSIGMGDAYPFVLSSAVEEKLVYVDSIIRRSQMEKQ